MDKPLNKDEDILRLKQVTAKTGISRATIYKSIKSGTFPKQVNLGPRSVGWLKSEIQNWIQERISASRRT